MRQYRVWTVAVLILGGCGRRSPPRPVEYIPVANGAKLPFSAAVRVGPLVPGGIAPETRQALENIRRILEANGSSLDHVVKCTVMLADMQEWGAMNQVYVTFFPTHLPARSAFGTSGLARNARVELECWATVS